MGSPVTLDFSKAVPIGDQTQDEPGQAASDLRKSVSYGASQNPDQYAKLLEMQKQTGVPPQVAQGNESEVQQSADVNSLDYAMFVAHHPLTTKWASNPDNAAVSGADEIQRLGNIESSAASIRASTPWETFEGNYLAPLRQKLMEFPLTRMGVDAVGGAAGMVGNIGSELGWHGDGSSSENAPQRLESYLSPENANLNINGRPDTGNPMDAVVKNVAPMIPITLATGGTGLLARTMGLSTTAAKVLSGLSIGALFTADQGGSTFTQMKKAGASDYDARLAANRVSLINAPLNAMFGMTDLVPLLKENPLATSMVLGGAQGATGQMAQNVVTNKPLSDNLLTSALQGFAVQGGFHLGTGFFEDMANIVTSAEQSKLRARSPEKFQEALSQIFDGQQSLRIPSEQFETYFQGKNIDAMQVAQQLGVTNYAEAKLSGGDVEISPADFIGKLDPEHQKGLLGDVVNPSTGMTLNEQRDGEAELQKWVASGGPEKLSADTAQADAETQSSDEYQAVKTQLQKQYTDAGETPQIAENYATLQANVYTNLARETGMTPSELMWLYRPKIVLGDGPQGPSAGDNIIAHVEPHPEGEVNLFGSPLQPRQNSSRIQQVKLSDLALAPERFQYKLNTDSTGVTNLLRGRKWNDQLADPITVWRDPADGKTYVVNGHHRLQLAKENGITSLWVKTLESPNAEDARAVGALQNIAAGRGTSMDAAKFFRDTGITPDKLDKLGISLGEATAAKGVALARLEPHIFDQVVSGKIREGRAVAIGNATSDPAEQESILKLVKKAEKKGKRVTDEVVDELARMVKGAGQHTETQDSLFGVQEMTRNLALEKAEVSNAIREKIASERRVFQSVSQESKAAQLGKVEGQRIDAKKNAEIAVQAAQAQELYDRLSTRGGPIDDILNGAAKELAKGGNANGIKDRAYSAVRDELSKAIAGSPAEGDRGISEAAQTSDPLFQRRKVRPEDSLSLPGMEDADKQRAEAAEAALGESLTKELLGPFGSTNKAVGEMERESPLFRGTGDNPTLFQGEKPRGWFRTLPDGSFEIGKTNIGDLSTFIHEPAHSYLFMLSELAQKDGASEGLKSDYQKIMEFLGAKDGEALTTEQHEKWARANEQYLRDGKAPSQSLKGVFQRFAVWLSSIYKRASDLGVGLSDDIRGVFDRLYAAEDGVNRAEKESGPKLFSTAEEAGWTEEQFKNYAESRGVESEQAKSEILSKLNEAAVRERSESWREEENNVREAVTTEVDQKPEYQAIRALRKGELSDGTELKLNRDELVKQFGEERVKELQKQHPGLYRNEGGTDAETAAEILGFGSGEEMMRAMEAAPRRSQAIAQATRDYMTAKHGDIRYDGTLDDQARLALEGDRKASNLHRELSALRKKVADLKGDAADRKAALRSSSEATAPLEIYRTAANRMIEDKPLADLNPHRYLEASRKHSREALDAISKGKVDEAIQSKHKELMNHFLYREAVKAKEFVGKFEGYVQKAQSPKVQQKLGLAGGDYRDQYNNLLARYGLTTSKPGQTARGLSDWAQEQYNSGKEPAIDPAILNEARTINYRNAPVSEVKAVYDALRNIQHLAYQELGMTVNGKKIEFDQAKADMEQRVRDTLTSKPERVLGRNKTIGEKATDLIQRGDALLMRTERLMEWLDGGKTGPWHDNLWHLAADSQGREYELQEQVTKSLGDALEKMPKEQRLKMTEKVTVTGVSETTTRHDLVSWALNMGNEGNLDRLQKTFMVHGWDPQAIETAKGMLTREEWGFVQDAWKTLEILRPHMVDLEKRLTGVSPVLVASKPFDVTLADGSAMHLDGGYYPVAMDPKFSSRGALQDAGTTAQNLMEAGYGRATTSRGYTKERSGFGGPLLLDYEQVLTQHTAKVIKDITHREFMLAANKLLTDQGVRSSLRETLGGGFEEQFMPWLRTIINDRNGSAVQGLGDFSRAMRGLRSNLTLASLTWKISTSLLQWTHAPRMLLSTNAGSYAQAMVDFAAHPLEVTQQIRELSPNEMRFRGENLDRDVRDKLLSMTGQKSVAHQVARAGSASIKYTDHVLSFPLWLSVYRDGLKENVDLPEEDAKYAAMQKADSAVRLGLGSAAPKDLPPIMRNNDMAKLLTMFYSFHNGIYGQVRDIAHNTDSLGDIPKLTYGLTLAVLVPALTSALALGQRPKDGENVGLWAAKRALLFSADTIPLLRDVASAMERDGDIKFTPLVGVLEKGTKALMEAGADKPNKDWTGIGLNALETGMDVAGVPGTAQVMKPLRYANAASKGKVQNPNAWDAFVGSGRK